MFDDILRDHYAPEFIEHMATRSNPLLQLIRKAKAS